MNDQDIARELREAQAARKLAEARARVSRMLAKKRGDLKRMPPQGRAALEIIRRGYW
jgi:hypothetical protein